MTFYFPESVSKEPEMFLDLLTTYTTNYALTDDVFVAPTMSLSLHPVKVPLLSGVYAVVRTFQVRTSYHERWFKKE